MKVHQLRPWTKWPAVLHVHAFVALGKSLPGLGRKVVMGCCRGCGCQLPWLAGMVHQGKLALRGIRCMPAWAPEKDRVQMSSTLAACCMVMRRARIWRAFVPARMTIMLLGRSPHT